MLHTSCRTRKRLAEVRQAGYTAIAIEDNDKATEILQFIYLEQAVKIERRSARVPTLCVEGANLMVTWSD